MEKTPYSFSVRVLKWALTCFGSTRVYQKQERVARFLEEALELAQASGISKQDARILLDYVFSRPPGDFEQEVGGVMNTLALLTETSGIDMWHAAEVELNRCWDNMKKIQEKNLTKPKLMGYDPVKEVANSIVDGHLPDVDPLGR